MPARRLAAATALGLYVASPTGFEAPLELERGRGRPSDEVPDVSSERLSDDDNPATSGAAIVSVIDSPDAPATPRARIVTTLNLELGAAIDAGDIEAARAAHEALGRLLGAPGKPAKVVDLAAEKARRGGKR